MAIQHRSDHPSREQVTIAVAPTRPGRDANIPPRRPDPPAGYATPQLAFSVLVSAWRRGDYRRAAEARRSLWRDLGWLVVPPARGGRPAR